MLRLDVGHLQVDVEGAVGLLLAGGEVGVDGMRGEVDLGDRRRTRYFCCACRYSSTNLETCMRCREVAGSCSEVYFLRP